MGDARTPLFTIHNPTPSAGSFGSSVVGLGSNFLVGDPNIFGTTPGVVYEYSASNGSLVHTFNSPDPSLLSFGYSIYAVGSNFVAGNYLINGSTGAVLQTFAVSGSAYATFGNSLVIATPQAQTGFGRAQVYSLATGSLTTTLQEPNPANLSGFGGNVVANANYIAVSADNTNNGVGTVFVYSAATGQLVRTINSPTPSLPADFGISMALNGNTLLVSSFGTFSSPGPSYTGSIYQYDVTTGVLQATIVNPIPHTNDEMGQPVTFDGPNVFAGVPLKQNAGGGQGAAYLFDGTGNLLATYQNPLATSNFGGVIATSGSNVAIPDPSIDSGRVVYVFSAAVPEPSALALFSIPLGLLMGRRGGRRVGSRTAP